MKHTLKLAMVCLAAGSFLFSSCKKDDTGIDFLVDAGAWKQIKEESGAGGVWTENTIDACTADDTWTFTDDTKLVLDEGASKCESDDPQSITGNWTLSEDEKTLTITTDGQALAYTVEELTSSRLVIKVNAFLFEIRHTFVPK